MSSQTFNAEVVDAIFRERDQLKADNAKLRELALNLYAEWRFAHARMRYIVLQHEERMREIEQRMRELGVEVE